jgi:Zn-dependent protease with chaperone function
MNDFRDVALSYVLNYAIHSTLLIGAVWLLVRALRPSSNPLRESLWTVALFGGFVTAAIQTAALGSRTVDLTPLPIDATPRASDVAAQPLAAGGEASFSEAPILTPRNEQNTPPRLATRRVGDKAASEGRRYTVGAGPEVAIAAARESEAVAVPVAPSLFERVGETSAAALVRARGVVAVCGDAVVRVSLDLADIVAQRTRIALGFAALAGAAWWCVLLLRSRRALAARERLDSGELRQRLDSIRTRFGVAEKIELSVSESIATPVAFGVRRFEICVPRRATELDAEQQEAMFAHEVAHLVRRDPLRLLLARAIECVAFFQPLNRLARRELFEVVEARCDAFAVERLGGGLALAGCLAEVASWLCDRQPRSFVPAMAEVSSTLGRRIEDLLDEQKIIAREHHQRLIARATYVVLPAIALFAPGVAIGSAPELAPKSTVVDAHPTAPTPRVSDDAVEVALLEVMSALDAEISALQIDIAAMRVALGDAGYEHFDEQLCALEERLENMNQKRLTVSAAWQRLRDADLDDEESATDEFDLDTETETALPALPRRKP